MGRPPLATPSSREENAVAIKEFVFSARKRNALRNDRETELLRSELFSKEQLKCHAVTLAGRHRIDPRPGPDRLLPGLADNARVLPVAYNVVTTAATPGQRIVPAEAWLLDNFSLIEQQIGSARRHLPRGYSRQLPRDLTPSGFYSEEDARKARDGARSVVSLVRPHVTSPMDGPPGT